MDTDLLRPADACACFMNKKPSKNKLLHAGIEMTATRTFQKSGAVGSYHRTLVYPDLSSRKHRRKDYGDGVLKRNVARFSRCLLQS